MLEQALENFDDGLEEERAAEAALPKPASFGQL